MKKQLLHGALAFGLAASFAIAQNENKPAAKPAAVPAKPAVVPAKPAAVPAKPVDPAAIKADSSYGFGYQTGRRFATEVTRWGLTVKDIENETFIKGFFDAFTGGKPQIEEAKIQAAMQSLGETLKKREAIAAQKNLEAGKAFLAENAKHKDVICTKSGLQYKILKKGDGSIYKAPTEGSRDNTRFLVNYRGTLIDGTEFDASAEGKPVPMTLQVIPGFKEALTQMPVGSKWRLFIPSDLAYGAQRRSEKIGANSTLIFDLELLEIQKAPQNRAVSPPIQVPPPSGKNATGKTTRPRAVSQPVRIPPAPRKNASGKNAKTQVVSPPVRIPPMPKKEN